MLGESTKHFIFTLHSFYFISLNILRRRTSSVGKVEDSESGGPRFESCNKLFEKILLVLLDKSLYQTLYWIMTTFCDYENGMLKDPIAALQLEYIIYTKLSRTKIYH